MSSTPQSLDGRTFAIGILSVTATVLFVGFLLVAQTPKPAYGIGQLDRSGDWIMLTQQVSNSNEAVVVIDAATQKLNVYALDYSRKQLTLLQRDVPLGELPAPEGRRVP